MLDRYHRDAMILIGQPEDHLDGPRTSSPRPPGPGECRRLAAVVAGLAAGWRMEPVRDKHGRAIIARLPVQRDDAIGPSRVVLGGEPASRRDGPYREAGRTLGGNPAWLDGLRAGRIRPVRQMHVPAICH
jgi:hypothetical protein